MKALLVVLGLFIATSAAAQPLPIDPITGKPQSVRLLNVVLKISGDNLLRAGNVLTEVRGEDAHCMQMLEQMQKMSQPDPQAQQTQQQGMQMDLAGKQADVEKKKAEANKLNVEAEIAPKVANAKMIAALSNNLDDDNEGKDFERRAKIADLMIKERDITSNENIAKMQMESKRAEKQKDADYMTQAASLMQ